MVKINMLKKFLYAKDKTKVYLVGILHIVMVCIGIWSLVDELIELQEPVTSHDIVYIAIHYTVHFVLILCLFIGVYAETPFFFIPWLGATTVIYIYITLLTMTSLDNLKLHNIVIYLINFIYVGVCWYTWYVVFSYFKIAYKQSRAGYQKYLLE